jgi:hypothetical protein
MNEFFCSRYAGSGTVWPVSAFPANLFPNPSNQSRSQQAIAWAFFETVESADAATRVAYSLQGGRTPPAPSAFPQNPAYWYPIGSEGKRILYLQGQALHQQVCSSYNWQSQRSLGIPTTPLTNVYPAPCP